MQRSHDRHVKGAAFVDLVRFLKNLGKERALPPVSANAQALLTDRVVGAEWYKLDSFLELLRVADRVVLRGDEARTIEMGSAGGSTIRGLLQAYALPGDVQSSVLAMRHAWRAYYDFGSVAVTTPGERVVTFQHAGYPDIPKAHALLTAGWALAAARVAGSAGATLEFIERPWQGDSLFVYNVHF